MDAISSSAVRAGYRLIGFALIVLAALSLSGCGGGPGGSFFGGASNWFGRPKTMAVAPIIGAPTKIGQEMTQQLVAAGQARGLTLIPGGTNTQLIIRGYLVATKARHGATISYIWDITDANGKRVNRISGEQDVKSRGSDPWSGVGLIDLHAIAEKTATALAGGARTPPPATTQAAPPPTASAPPPAPAATTSQSSGGISGFFRRTFGSSSKTPAPQAPPMASVPTAPVVVYVAPVSGAPGDGRTSLTDALRKRIAASGVKLARSGRGSVYKVDGKVTMANAGGGKQTIRIDWRVADPTGRRLGTVTQQNTITAGSLSGHWGNIANAAAGAAADGILKLLPHSAG